MPTHDLRPPWDLCHLSIICPPFTTPQKSALHWPLSSMRLMCSPPTSTRENNSNQCELDGSHIRSTVQEPLTQRQFLLPVYPLSGPNCFTRFSTSPLTITDNLMYQMPLLSTQSTSSVSNSYLPLEQDLSPLMHQVKSFFLCGTVLCITEVLAKSLASSQSILVTLLSPSYEKEILPKSPGRTFYVLEPTKYCISSLFLFCYIYLFYFFRFSWGDGSEEG